MLNKDYLLVVENPFQTQKVLATLASQSQTKLGPHITAASLFVNINDIYSDWSKKNPELQSETKSLKDMCGELQLQEIPNQVASLEKC